MRIVNTPRYTQEVYRFMWSAPLRFRWWVPLRIPCTIERISGVWERAPGSKQSFEGAICVS